MLSTLTNLFQEKAGSLFQGGIVEPLLWTTVGACLVGAGALTKRLRSRRALTKSTLLGPYTLVGETLYEPTGALNPITGEEFYNQKIRNWRDNVAISNIFNQEISDDLVKYINKARSLCTPENPVVFAHLDKVVPEKDRKFIHGTLIRHWVNFFSSQLVDLPGLYINPLHDRETRAETSIWPVLIYEPEAAMKQYRVLLLTAVQLNASAFPKMENTRILFKGQWIQDSEGPQAKRLEAHLAIANILGKPENAWVVENTLVNVPTLERVKIPVPEPLNMSLGQ